MDLHDFMDHMELGQHGNEGEVAAIGTSLGAAILW